MVRDYETLEVILTEIPKNGTKYQSFPPIFNIPLDDNNIMDISRIQKKIKWDVVAANPLFFWPAPVDLTQKNQLLEYQKYSCF